jgi:hypothetical protein
MALKRKQIYLDAVSRRCSAGVASPMSFPMGRDYSAGTGVLSTRFSITSVPVLLFFSLVRGNGMMFVGRLVRLR